MHADAHRFGQLHLRGEIVAQRLQIALALVWTAGRRHIDAEHAVADPAALCLERNPPREPAAGEIQHYCDRENDEPNAREQSQEFDERRCRERR